MWLRLWGWGGRGRVIKPLSPRRPPSFLKSSWIHGFRHVARALAKVTTERRVNRGVNAFIYQHPQRHHALEPQTCQAILHRQPPGNKQPHFSLTSRFKQTDPWNNKEKTVKAPLSDPVRMTSCSECLPCVFVRLFVMISSSYQSFKLKNTHIHFQNAQ